MYLNGDYFIGVLVAVRGPLTKGKWSGKAFEHSTKKKV